MQRFVFFRHGSAAALFVLAALLSAGCGHGHHRHHSSVYYGTLEVFNARASVADVDGIETRGSSGRAEVFKPVVAPPGTGVFFDLVTGHYDVVVFWDNGSRDTFFDVDIDRNHTTTLSVRF